MCLFIAQKQVKARREKNKLSLNWVYRCYQELQLYSERVLSVLSLSEFVAPKMEKIISHAITQRKKKIKQ